MVKLVRKEDVKSKLIHEAIVKIEEANECLNLASEENNLWGDVQTNFKLNKTAAKLESLRNKLLNIPTRI